MPLCGSLHELTEGDLKAIKPIDLLGKPYSSTKLAEVLKFFAASKNSSISAHISLRPSGDTSSPCSCRKFVPQGRCVVNIKA